MKNPQWKNDKDSAMAPCPKCDGRGYRGGFCLDCGTYWNGEKHAFATARTVGRRLQEAYEFSNAAFGASSDEYYYD
jgi:hypothetical protein